jgi:hypothetical protein
MPSNTQITCEYYVVQPLEHCYDFLYAYLASIYICPLEPFERAVPNFDVTIVYPALVTVVLTIKHILGERRLLKTPRSESLSRV